MPGTREVKKGARIGPVWGFRSCDPRGRSLGVVFERVEYADMQVVNSKGRRRHRFE